MDDLIAEIEQMIEEDDPDLLETLVEAVGHRQQRVRIYAGLRLGELFQDARAIPALAEALEAGSRREQTEAASLLWEIADADTPGMLRALHHAPTAARDTLADALYRIGWSPMDADTAVAYYITTHQWRECIVMGSEAVPGLLSALADWDGSVRRGAAWALGEIGDGRAVAGLAELLNDPSGGLFGEGGRVCDIAAEALERIGTAEAVDVVRAWREAGEIRPPDGAD